MDSNVLQRNLTTGKAELLSHKLSDSDSEGQGDLWNSQLSPISSQPSLPELQTSCTVLTAASLDSPVGSYQPDRPGSPDASTIGPGSSDSSSAVPAEVNEMADHADEGSQGTSSLKAESELLDPWDVPFETSLPVSRCCQHYITCCT